MVPNGIRIHEHGGPEVMRWEPTELPVPRAGEALVRHVAVGLNFIDIYHRSGLYPLPLPSGLGSEAAGVVEAVGEGVTAVAPGDRVAYTGGPIGAYAEARVMPANVLIKLPDAIDERTAAAMMLKGLTAWYLLRRTHVAQAGETVVITAAAGGVGLIFCQWARALGVRVIGTVGSEAKAELARAHGCSQPIVLAHGSGAGDLVARVKALTDGAGVPVVYDSVGKDTIMASLDCLAPRGLLVSFGQSSGLVPPLDLRVLSQKGSLYVTRPTLNSYVASRDQLIAGTTELFDMVGSGAVKIEIGAEFALRDAADAHRALAARKTIGSTILRV